MKLTLFSLICLFLVFSFAGVKPLSEYKDSIIDEVTDYFKEQQEKSTVELEQNDNIQNEESEDDNKNSLINVAKDVVDDLWETNINDYANKFNQYRESKGLTPLEFTNDLNRVASLRLKELYIDFSHFSTGNYNEHLAENIAMSTGFLSNSDALTMWKNSPGHNANMLDSNYKYTGYAIGNGYAVQVFTEYLTINGEPQLPPGWYWSD